MDISQNYSRPSFGAIKGDPRAIVSRLGSYSKAIELVVDQASNKAADIVYTDAGVKVVAREAKLAYGLGKKGIKEFKPTSANCIDETRYRCEDGSEFDIGPLFGEGPCRRDYVQKYDLATEVCRKIANESNRKADFSYSENLCNTLESGKKILGALLDLDL